jgi:hypothetical protein
MQLKDYRMAQHIGWYAAQCYANVKQEHPDNFDELFPIDQDEEMDEDELVGTCQKIGLKRPD